MKVREQIMALSQNLDESWNVAHDYWFYQGLDTAATIAEASEREHEQFKKAVLDALEFYGGNDEGCTANLILKKIQSLSASASADSL